LACLVLLIGDISLAKEVRVLPLDMLPVVPPMVLLVVVTPLPLMDDSLLITSMPFAVHLSPCP
jgi:hypothetical protein